MASGFKTLEEIEQAITEARTREAALAREVEASNQARTQLLRERTAAVRELAVARARNAVADGVIDQADRLSADVEEILKARQASVDAIAARVGELESRHRELLARARIEHDRASELETRLDAVGDEARAALSADDGYRALVGEVERLSGQLAKATEKAAVAEQDREDKSRPYLADPLFVYLWRRDYGGRSYSATGLVRWIDGKVAELVGYSGARANYAMLTEIPVRLAEHAARLERDLASARDGLSQREADEIGRRVGQDLVGELKAARAGVHAIDAEITATAAALTEASGQRNRYAEGLDDSFRMATDTLTGFLESERYNALVDAARATPDRSDDDIVSTIGVINRKLETIAIEIRERQSEVETVARRRQELIRIAGDFRRKSYHQPGSVFEPDYDMKDLLEDVLKGALTAAEYWARTQRRQRWSGRSGDAFRRSSGSPPFEFPDFGGGRGRGGDSGWGKDDFKTGGGF